MLREFMICIALISMLKASVITPIPLKAEYDKEKAELGKKLFFDTILSKDNTISCATCHTMPGSGANPIQYSFGINASEGDVNTPTVLNSRFNFVQFWNGRAKDLKEQALFPIENPIEMASDIDDVLKKLTNSLYRQEFLNLYSDGINRENLADVLAEFGKALTTPNSRFDKYLMGDENAISEQEKRGFETFQEIGCISCHNGKNVGGNMYQTSGLIESYKQDKKIFGRYDVTKRERDKNVYRVPSLRNIELTAPYFHDGQMETLKDAIKQMQVMQLGIEPNLKNTNDIEAFLKTLTGETPEILKGMR